MRQSVRETMDCIGITAEDASIATKYRSLIVDVLPSVIDEFYDHLRTIGYWKYFGGIDIERLKALQYEHWRRLFRVDFDEIYITHVTRIGIVHRDRAITPRLYMQAYGWFTGRLIEELAGLPDVTDADRPRLSAVILKLVHFDMTIALASYEAALID